MPFPYTPYPIYGNINLPGSSGVLVTAKNNTTLEQITVISEIDSSYLIDCGNFPSGYTNGDIIQITVLTSSQTTIIDLTINPSGIRLDIGILSGLFTKYISNMKAYVM